MTKRRLTKQQSRRINEKIHHSAKEGLLISRFGSQADVEDESGRLIRCKFRQNIGSIVAGDKVLWEPVDDQHGVILSRKPRHSVLGRPDKQGHIRAIAANIDQIFIVVAIKPQLTLSLLDSYLVATELLNIPAKIILNKSDLPHQELLTNLKNYKALGYEVITTNVYDSQGLNELSTHLHHKTSVFVGQSGVGKSSLIKGLIPHESIATGQISSQSELGKHTTSMSRLYHLQPSGDIIDSPGIREFGLWHMPARDIAKGFIEFQPFLGQCKFRDCQHRKEPGCAIHAAVNQNIISLLRYKSYLKIA